MAKRRVAEIVTEGQSLREIIVKAEGASNGAGDLPDFHRMREAGAVMIAFMRDKDLGFVRQAAERRAVQDPVAVTLIRAARRRWRFGKDAAAAPRRISRIGSAPRRKGDILPRNGDSAGT